MGIELAQVGLVALGGALGGMLRYAISGLVARRWGESFPWGTLVVNVTGAAMIGTLAALILAPGDHSVLRPSLWLVFVTGVMGSYTTVSSFSLQTLALLRQGETARALANAAGSVVLCVGAAGLAMAAVLAAGAA
ncbi:fluoride efflux transporter CrcB (plasmid) [Cereibacter azotoformans]|uniref:fluoride efflux transporter CrcB n=1 Tax=Cereibacter azotoformans TaxID=43057 RepID=UPI001EEA1F63|nr:fluoride efflux transporter CrcB [Cereibacter azotoformans]ULB12447.1 fluoride efflux transporter CrcB [Cereibacter azotoformans]